MSGSINVKQGAAGENAEQNKMLQEMKCKLENVCVQSTAQLI